MTSADEKGVVRRTQSKDDMQITTPFGYRAQKIDLSTVDAVREKMDSNFAKALHGYLRGNAAIDVLHDQAVHILSEGMSQALGETRKPANDVTLWAQSHGVASLYKPVLATLALGLEPCPRKGNGELDYTNVRWRLFGIGWNGLGFVQRGRRPGDILRRQEILQDIRKKLKCLLEVEYPLGNLFYEDLNGLFFTFPGLHDQEVQAEALVKELAPKIVEVVRKQSDMELWPFFTLSRPRRTLTAITTEIRARDSLASLPRVAALLSLETAGSQREEKLLVDGPALEPPTVGEDICPVCQFRSKQQKEDACQVCKDRRSRRQDTWQGARHNQTIWIDEVADDNNRLALLTLRFDLSRWLSGEWLTTLYSQTIDNWASGSEFSALRTAGLTSRIRSFASSQRAPSPDLNNPSPALAMEIATLILKPGNPGVRASLLQSFFVSGEVLVREDQNSPYFVERHLENIAAKFEKDRNSLTPSELVENCFTQNPSPARLRRIWEATESFLTEGICSVGGDTFAASARPRRLHFTITSRLAWAQPRKTYRITIPRLGSVPLTVLCLESEKHCRFLTVDSLEKFHLSSDDRKLHGLPAVQVALESGGISEWLDEETGTTGVAGIPAHQVQGFDSEEYLPLIVLARSPIFCQLLLPAEKASHTLKRVSGLADKHFGKVRGKLPLSTTLLVVNRRFPLYALLDAGQMALDDPSFSEGSVQGLWWDAATHEADSFYGYYPMKKPNEDRGWTLTDLAPVNQVSRFWMTPGYFDFDFLGSTADRHNLIYERRDGRLVRLSIAYGALQPRPFAIHRLKDLLWVWDTLAATQLGPTQRHHVEEALSTKLEEWESVDWEAVRPVFNHFSKALLRQTFPEEKWAELSQEQRGLLERSANDGLLLEALELFQHVLKEESSHG
jgi:CRISPR-associated Csx11 family protein